MLLSQTLKGDTEKSVEITQVQLGGNVNHSKTFRFLIGNHSFVIHAHRFVTSEHKLAKMYFLKEQVMEHLKSSVIPREASPNVSWGFVTT